MRECSDSNVMGIYLSYLGSLRLQNPFRPRNVSALYRDLVNRFYRIDHHSYVAKKIKDAVGDTQTLAELPIDRKRPYDGYANYLRDVKLPSGQFASPRWENAPPTCQESRAIGRLHRTGDRKQAGDDLRQDFARYGRVVPLGPTDPPMSSDFDDAYDMMRDDVICGKQSPFYFSKLPPNFLVYVVI